MRWLINLGCLLLVVGMLSCGKNDDTYFSGSGYNSPYINNPYFPTNAQYPNYPPLQNPPQNYFNPQQGGGCPSQCGGCGSQYCYLYQPVMQYAQQFPQVQQGFGQFWGGFVNTCQQYQVNPYSPQGFDFFYTQYMPYMWPDLAYQMGPFYDDWYYSGINLPPQMDGGYFWYYAYGMPYSNVGGWDNCGGYGCGWY